MKMPWGFFGFLLLGPTTMAGLGACGEDGREDGGDDEGVPVTRTYYIAADEVWWDYAPQNLDVRSGMPFDERQLIFAGGALFDGSGSPEVAPVPMIDTDPNFVPNQIGKIYKKSLYREYTDESFTTLEPVPDAWKHLGTLGPVIRGVVGETIRVVFKNNSASQSYSIHPHGVFYGKDSEGTPYDDDTSDADKNDDIVPPGWIHTYTWKVPERAGPGPDDPSSIVWVYHSHTNEPADTNSGMIGPIIITRADMANPDATPEDVDREFVNLFTIYDENVSWYLKDNAVAAGIDPTILDDPDVAPEGGEEQEQQEEEFEESNLMHTINGFVFANTPADTPPGVLPMTMKKDEVVRWYIIGMGTEVDLHTPHWHGNTVRVQGHSTDVIELTPASMKTVDMLADNSGVWMYHCHVNDHIDAGMMTLYEVLP